MTTETERHQGFTNYETFVVGVWIDNEKALLDEVREMVANASFLEDWSPAAILKEWVYDRMPELANYTDLGDGPWSSLLRASFDEIDWNDLANHYLTDEGQAIHVRLKAAGVPLESHESDLYAKVTPESTFIVQTYQHSENVTTFTSEVDGAKWFDIPFANLTFWNAKTTS